MNNIGIMLFIIVLPIVLITLFVYNKDKHKEPIDLLVQLFLLGMLSCILTLGTSLILDNYLPFMKEGSNSKELISIFLYSFIGVALIEEMFKWIFLYLKGFKSKEFDELYDVVVYSIFISLGFAFLENVFFILSDDIINMSTIILRAVTAIPGHACYAVFMGYYLSLARKFKSERKKILVRNNIALSIIVPIMLHGIYDFCLLSNIRLLMFVFIGFMVILYIISYKKLEIASHSSKKIKHKFKFCKNCGMKVEKDFCPKCGKKISK